MPREVVKDWREARPRHSRDIFYARIHPFDTGHFALENYAKDIAAAVRDFVR